MLMSRRWLFATMQSMILGQLLPSWQGLMIWHLLLCIMRRCRVSGRTVGSA